MQSTAVVTNPAPVQTPGNLSQLTSRALTTPPNFRSPYRYAEPVPNVSAVIQGKTTIATFVAGNRFTAITITAVVTRAAAGGGLFSIPLNSDAIGEMRLILGGNVNRRRTSAQLHGYTGLNALNQDGNGGTVVYTQVGNANLSAVPVRIGSPEDTAQQALLTANTATTATFALPLIFAEDFRKNPYQGELMALITGYQDGTTIGSITLEMDVPVAANGVNAVALSVDYEYDKVTAPVGNVISLSKERILTKQYAAAGALEIGDVLQNGIPLGQPVQRISLLTVSDQITGILLKKGSTINRNFVTKQRSDVLLFKSGFNYKAILANRFDIEFDINDDANSAVKMDAVNQLSCVVTLATANDAGKTITILPSYYGPIE